MSFSWKTFVFLNVCWTECHLLFQEKKYSQRIFDLKKKTCYILFTCLFAFLQKLAFMKKEKIHSDGHFICSTLKLKWWKPKCFFTELHKQPCYLLFFLKQYIFFSCVNIFFVHCGIKNETRKKHLNRRTVFRTGYLNEKRKSAQI